MITICFTYRDREVKLVQKCLDSLAQQSNSNFSVIFINYGSDIAYTVALKELLNDYSFITYFEFETKFQLWNKSKAINFALKASQSDYFFVADVDLIFKKDFMEFLHEIKINDNVIYFKVGYLSKDESIIVKEFDEYEIKHYSSEEATGMTLYPRKILLNINGYDEFFHGWGSEDTDVHNRLRNADYEVKYFEEKLYLIHQWHLKNYRSKNSSAPFHSALEKNNMYYCDHVKLLKKVKANTTSDWGIVYAKNEIVNTNEIVITNQKSEIDALTLGSIKTDNTQIVLKVILHKDFNSLKNKIKKIIGKKALDFYSLDDVNNKLLEMLINHFRNSNYEFNRNKKDIILKIK